MYLQEAGRPFSETNFGRNLETAFLVNVERIRPDVVYFHSFDAVPHEVRQRIKREFPFVKLVAGHNGYMPASLGPYCDIDLAFIAFPTLIRAWKAAGIESEFLPHAFDPHSLTRLQSMDQEGRIPLSFVGHTGFGLDRHSQRYFLLRRLMEETDLTVWGLEHGDTPPMSPKQRFRSFMLAALTHVPLPLIKTVEVTLQRRFRNPAGCAPHSPRARDSRREAGSAARLVRERKAARHASPRPRQATHLRPGLFAYPCPLRYQHQLPHGVDARRLEHAHVRSDGRRHLPSDRPSRGHRGYVRTRPRSDDLSFGGRVP